MLIDLVDLYDAVHARLVHPDKAVALGVPLHVGAGLVRGERPVVVYDAHVVGLASLAGTHHRVDAGGEEANGDVVLVVFGDAAVRQALEPVVPSALQIDVLVGVIAGVFIERHDVALFEVLDVADVGRVPPGVHRAVVPVGARVELPRHRTSRRRRVGAHVAGRPGDGLAADPAQVRPCLFQQCPDPALSFGIGALADVGVAHLAVRVDQILRGPRTVPELPPRLEVVVLDYGIPEVVVDRRLLHVLGDFLELELRRVHTENHQARVGVLLMPVAEPGEGAYAVDAGVRPEVDKDDLAPTAFDGEGLGVDPRARPGERGRGVGRRRGLARCRRWCRRFGRRRRRGRRGSRCRCRRSRCPRCCRRSLCWRRSGGALPAGARRHDHRHDCNANHGEQFLASILLQHGLLPSVWPVLKRANSRPLLDSTPECHHVDVFVPLACDVTGRVRRSSRRRRPG